MLDSIRRALRPGGRLIVIDFERVEGRSSSWVLGHVRAGREQVIREVEAAGFRFVRAENLLKDNFYLHFASRPEPGR
jgi:predicted methyltransferase